MNELAEEALNYIEVEDNTNTITNTIVDCSGNEFYPLLTYPSFKKLEHNKRIELQNQIISLMTKGKDEKWLIQDSELAITDKIGEGSCSVIHNCKWRGIDIVIKKTKMKKLALLNDLLKEIYIWSGLRHPNLVQFLGFNYSKPSDDFNILMEKIDGLNLTQYIERKNMSRPTLRVKYHICAELISVFQFLHSCKPAVIYRDLKPENVMIDKFNKVKLTDFGLCRFMPEEEPYKMTGTTGTIRYMAPEVYLGQKYNLNADVYSLGLVIYYVFTGEKPFKDYDTTTIKTYFYNSELIFSTKNIKNKNLRTIINKCIVKNNQERWSIDELAEEFEKFMKNNNQEFNDRGCHLS